MHDFVGINGDMIILQNVCMANQQHVCVTLRFALISVTFLCMTWATISCCCANFHRTLGPTYEIAEEIKMSAWARMFVIRWLNLASERNGERGEIIALVRKWIGIVALSITRAFLLLSLASSLYYHWDSALGILCMHLKWLAPGGKQTQSGQYHLCEKANGIQKQKNVLLGQGHKCYTICMIKAVVMKSVLGNNWRKP